MLKLLLETIYTRAKQPALQRANPRLEVARHLWPLAHELEGVPTLRYAHGAGLIDGLGRRVSGAGRSRPKAAHVT